MADQKISDLAAAASLVGSELFEVVQGGVNKKATPSIIEVDSLAATAPLSVAKGGTGGTTAATARAGISAAELGTNSDITSITGLLTALSVAQGGTGGTDATTARANLGLLSMSIQSATAVSITGGAISGITDLAVADGGTGASTASDARTNLGLLGMAIQAASSVSVTGGTITGITDLETTASGIIKIPNAAGGTTIDANGKMCVDTTSGSLNFYDGAAERAIPTQMAKSFYLELPTSADDLPIMRMDAASTLTKIVYSIAGSTNWVGQLQTADDAIGTNSVDTAAADSTVTTTATVTAFSAAAVGAGKFVRIKTTSVSGTPSYIHVTFYYRQDP